MNEYVIIIGASGHGTVIADIVLRSGDRVLGFLDDNPHAPQTICGFPLLGKTTDFVRYPEARFIIAIGNAPTALFEVLRNQLFVSNLLLYQYLQLSYPCFLQKYRYLNNRQKL